MRNKVKIPLLIIKNLQQEGIMRVLSREEMYYFDDYTMNKFGIPSSVLMENASKGCSSYIHFLFLKKKSSRIHIVCGSGNNGGDGFGIARWLYNWGHLIKIVFVGSENKMSRETKLNFNLCKKLEIEILQIDSVKKFSIDFSNSELIIDAIMGIGFKGKLTGWKAELILKINALNIPIIAIDIATGIDADTGSAEVAIKADFTLTMASPKYGQLIGEGREKTGKLEIIDIGIPPKIYSLKKETAELIDSQTIKFPLRNKFSHKGNYGKIGIIAGSDGYSGAAIMASKAALRAGGGLIYLFHPQELHGVFDAIIPEIITKTIKESMLDKINFHILAKELSKLDVLLIGPGISVNSKTSEMVTEILKFWEKPLVLDADAINILSENKEILQLIKSKNVLVTPHVGEFSRLTGYSIEEIQNDSLKIIKDFYDNYKINILLKSATSIFYNGEKFYFNTTGNDGLSTGGSGDVLAGIIISFLGQKLSIKDSAITGAYLLGKTAEFLSEKRQTNSIIPTDIIENLFMRE